MTELALQRCHNHPDREAVARCPECGRFFCRECITEHDEVVLCAQCLARRLQPAAAKKRRFGALTGLLPGAVGVGILWVFFYYVGLILLKIPSSFHEGTIWGGPW